MQSFVSATKFRVRGFGGETVHEKRVRMNCVRRKYTENARDGRSLSL